MQELVKVVELTVVRRIPLQELICSNCEQKFYGMRLRKYCSSQCQTRAAWQRNRQVQLARQRKRRLEQKLLKKTKAVA